MPPSCWFYRSKGKVSHLIIILMRSLPFRCRAKADSSNLEYENKCLCFPPIPKNFSSPGHEGATDNGGVIRDDRAHLICSFLLTTSSTYSFWEEKKLRKKEPVWWAIKPQRHQEQREGPCRHRPSLLWTRKENLWRKNWRANCAGWRLRATNRSRGRESAPSSL